MQRDQQNRLMDEMFSPISNQILPASIEERLELYKYRNKLDEKNIKYKIVKDKFLNYRQFNFQLIKGKKEIIPAYAIIYSTIPRKKAQGRIEFEHQNIHYFNRDEIRFLTIYEFNQKAKSNYKNVKELIFNPLSFDDELKIRESITMNFYDLSTIIIVDKIIESKLTIKLDAKSYEDTKEKLIVL